MMKANAVISCWCHRRGWRCGGRKSSWIGKNRRVWNILNATRKSHLMSSRYQARSSGSIHQRATGLSFRTRTFPTFSYMWPVSDTAAIRPSMREHAWSAKSWGVHGVCRPSASAAWMIRRRSIHRSCRSAPMLLSSPRATGKERWWSGSTDHAALAF
jgi:hypothetical protein